MDRMTGTPHAAMIRALGRAGWKTRGWKSAVLAQLVKPEWHDDECVDVVRASRVVPDAWRLEERAGRLLLTFIEVECSNPAAGTKLWRIERLFWAFDASMNLEFACLSINARGEMSDLVTEFTAAGLLAPAESRI